MSNTVPTSLDPSPPNSTEYRDSDHYRETAARLAERPPLPSVDDIAGPILRSLLALHDLREYDGIVDGFAYGVDEGEFHDEARALVELVEGVATAVEIGVAGVLEPRSQAMHRWNARAIVMAVADVDGLREALHRPTYERLMYGDEGGPS